MRTTLCREEMMDCLLEVFRRDGVEGASVVDLMRAVGLQKGSLYHHFPRGKTEIAEAVLEHVERLFEAMVFSPLREAATAVDGVAAMCHALEVYFAQGRKVCLPALIGLGPGAGAGRCLHQSRDARRCRHADGRANGCRYSRRHRGRSRPRAIRTLPKSHEAGQPAGRIAIKNAALIPYQVQRRWKDRGQDQKGSRISINC